MTIILAAAAATLLFLLLIFLMIYVRQMPRIRMKRKMNLMIAEAEKERAEARRLESKAKVQEEVPPHLSFEDTPFRDRVLRPLQKSVESALLQFTPKELRTMLENQLFHAGQQERWTVNRLAASWVLSVGAGALLAMSLAWSMKELHFFQRIALLLLGTGAGAALPFLLLQSAVRKRRRQLLRQLPEFLDLLCVSVQAGLSFDGAVAKITERMKGPLIEEFRRMQRDMSLGMVRQRSMMQLARRCDLEEVYLFTTSVIQAERLGTSMTKTLKQQADNMRDRHRQTVRTAAMKAPIKIIFPMILFIFPSIFVMVLFPALLTLLRSMGQ